MKRRWWCLLAVIVWLLTGVFVVAPNEKGVVRRFGRLVPELRGSGLQLDLPWPFTSVDRVNFNEIRTLSLGDVEADANFLLATKAAQPAAYLTGDKNLLQLKLNVQYRISELRFADWLYGSASPVHRLQLLVESTVTDVVSRCGVDFVHTLGLAELNSRLLRDVRRQVDVQQLGCEVEQVTVDRAEPPARAKAEFLDVSNARADMSRSIYEARGYAEQKLAESQADARKIVDEAERIRLSKASGAQGSADRFLKLIGQIQGTSEIGSEGYRQSRQLVMNRIIIEVFQEVFSRAKTKVVLESDKPFDLTFPSPRPDKP